VYLGQLTGCRHQVLHRAADPAELLWDRRLGDLSVSVMMRCALFGHNRARLRGTTPSPIPFFHILAEVFSSEMASASWRLPSMDECLRAYGRPQAQAPAAVAAPVVARRRLQGKQLAPAPKRGRAE
jgi:hypothetical protein